MTPSTLLLLVGVTLGAASNSTAGIAIDGKLELPWIFSDHMVLQRDAPIQVFGEARPGAEVRVSFAGETATAVASDQGHWRLQLDAQVAETQGRPLTIESGSETRRFIDVVIGEVWLCAGQSNMDFPLRRATNSGAAARLHPKTSLIRLCDRNGSAPPSAVAYGRDTLDALAGGRFFTGSWSLPSPEVAADFSAVGFFFGNELERALNVPIGLIDVSVGGSSTEGWIPRDRLADEPALAPLVLDYLSTELTHPFIRERTSAHLATWILSGREGSRPRHHFEPGYLYEHAIAPLAPFSIRGVTWYQGESNAHRPALAGRLLDLLIKEWRDAFEQEDLPFYFVQLPGLNRRTWPRFREMQQALAARPNVGMAVTIDVGHPTDVHPKDKQAVGERLAALALARTYGKDQPCDGPTLMGSRADGSSLVLSFLHADGLAWATGRSSTGFEVMGEARRYYPALAEIHGSTVVLSSPEVDRPVNARYAWAPDPEWSLVNGAGLPAPPFRTWDGEPEPKRAVGARAPGAPGHGWVGPFAPPFASHGGRAIDAAEPTKKPVGGPSLPHPERLKLRLYLVLRSHSNGDLPQVSKAAPDPEPGRGSRHPADSAVPLFQMALGSTEPGTRWTELVPPGAIPERAGPEVGLGRMLFAAGERDFAILVVSVPPAPQGTLPGKDTVKAHGRFVESAMGLAVQALPPSIEWGFAAFASTLEPKSTEAHLGQLRGSFSGPSTPRLLCAPPPGIPMELGRRFARAWLSQGGAPSWRRSIR